MEIVWENTVIALIAIGILYFLLNKYAFGPLLSVMEKRRELVQQQLSEASQTREQATAFVEEQKAALQQARKEAYDIIEQSKQTSSKQAAQMLDQAKDEATRLKEEAVRDIQNEKNRAVEQLRSEVGAVSVKIASKLIEKEVSEEGVQGELVDKYLKEVGGRS
ncbi:MAG: F0F1 ATP synthase subunit B [Paenibacillaceae bacterium]|uniref:ATP synthase subunit b n=1 Tax=Paenibacillus mellifer TaxID=2937794 RepID=A0A9X1XZP3_9BACL|nr:F0F1 ATP synthase subunit B [Paenibacillus mellifer]MBW4839865.1 F0F1 ATP synthase subunit B [Paenibacillaceae bacterium]MCK8488232.1 F0F1 ATP synthase subunit B [Paenibacillus mellifer]